MHVGYAGLWLGILKQLAQHMGPILCVLDLSLHWSNIGCMAIPCYLPPTRSKAEESIIKLFLVPIVKHYANVLSFLVHSLFYFCWGLHLSTYNGTYFSLGTESILALSVLSNWLMHSPYYIFGIHLERFNKVLLVSRLDINLIHIVGSFLSKLKFCLHVYVFFYERMSMH